MRGELCSASSYLYSLLVRVCCYERDQSSVLTLIQCSTDPVLVTCASSRDGLGADGEAAKCILQYLE